MNPQPRILICDDEPHILHVVSLRLQREGYLPLLSSTAEQALELIANEPPDLCIVDQKLPGMNGSGLCKALRSTPGLEDVPIIMLTAMDLNLPDLSDGEAGPNTVMGKPFSPSALAEQIRGLLSRVPNEGGT